MNSGNIIRRLRGVAGNAVVWGGFWFIATLAVSSLMGVLDPPFVWADIWRRAARVGVVGGLSGVVFSTFIGLRYHGRRLSEISWLRFGLGGGIVAGLFLPALMFVGRTISGDPPLAIEKYLSSALTAAVFGAVAAAATMWLAQRGDPPTLHGGEDEPAQLGSGDTLGTGSVPQARAEEPVRRRPGE